tara:strand:+ start:51 stop:848 length:798 start_codon:yes stop_codon:yes gene_type:complete
MAGSNVAQLCFDKVVTNDYHSLSFGCRNFEEVLIEIDEQVSGASAVAENLYISIFAGTKSIVNRVKASYLASICQYEAGTGDTSTANQVVFAVDTGTWYLEKGDELIVKLDGSGITATHTMKVTVHAVVNGCTAPSPKRFMLRNDNAFLSEGCSQLYAFGTALDEVNEPIELTMGSETISQAITGLNAKTNSDSVGDAFISNMALVYDGLPRDMQVNYGGSTSLEFLTLADVQVSSQDLANSFRHIQGRLSQITPKEQKYLANRD